MFQPGGSRKQGINAPVPDTGFVPIKHGNIGDIFFDTDGHMQEKIMRSHPTPIHTDHLFNTLLRTLGPSRPEIKLLGEFIRYCRKVYQSAKKLRLRIKNTSGALQVMSKHTSLRQRTIFIN